MTRFECSICHTELDVQYPHKDYTGPARVVPCSSCRADIDSRIDELRNITEPPNACDSWGHAVACEVPDAVDAETLRGYLDAAYIEAKHPLPWEYDGRVGDASYIAAMIRRNVDANNAAKQATARNNWGQIVVQNTKPAQ